MKRFALAVGVAAAFGSHAWAAEVPGPDFGAPEPDAPAVQEARFRRDVFYVVDATVLRSERDGDPVWAVVWEDVPLPRRGARVVSREWVVVDGTGRLLTAAQFGVLSQVVADARPRPPRTMLGGVQVHYERDQVEALAAERTAASAARVGLDAVTLDQIHEEVVAGLPEPTWAPVPPAPLD